VTTYLLAEEGAASDGDKEVNDGGKVVAVDRARSEGVHTRQRMLMLGFLEVERRDSRVLGGGGVFGLLVQTPPTPNLAKCQCHNQRDDNGNSLCKQDSNVGLCGGCVSEHAG
jgi:hypothetical protein